MTQVREQPAAFTLIRIALTVALPPAALGLLRLFPPLSLQTGDGDLARWVAPVLAGGLGLAGAAATVLALIRAFGSRGRLGELFEAAGLGALTSAAAAAALGGADVSAAFPTPVVGLGLAAAGMALLAAEVTPMVRLGGRGQRLALAALVFAWIEAAPAVGLIGAPLAPFTSLLAGAGAVLIGIAAVSAIAGEASELRILWLALLATSAASLALARTGSVDALAGTIGLLAGASIAATRAYLRLSEAEGLEPVALLTSGPIESRDEREGDRGESLRLARELRGTIAELIAARQTVELQRQEIERLASVDPVTDVASRRHILARLGVEIAQARRYAHPLAVVLIDLDEMTGLNRSQGLEIGDAVLRELALRLRLRVREADALGRLDGDRFLAILPHTDERGATVFANAVRTRLTARPVESTAGPVAISVSIGITMVRAGEELDTKETLGRAEEALASARAAGGNRIAFDRAHGLARLEERRSETDADAGARPSEPSA
jgi:diguanylate cyclase (GGDEF)-like protein